MFLSKSFGYALRGILYVASRRDEQRKVQIGEIAEQLSVPRHFLGKIMQQVVKAGLLQSTKGPFGGFFLHENTLDTPLIRILEVTDGLQHLNLCVLQFRSCNKSNPCPLHEEMDLIKTQLLNVMKGTTIAQLLNKDGKNIIHSLMAMNE